MRKDMARILFTEDEIRARVRELGREITRDYAECAEAEGLVLVCVLRGAAIFAADLAREIDLSLEIDFVTASSYGDATVSSGVVNIQKGLSSDIAGKHVVIVEDILDSGLTLSRLKEVLRSCNPASVATCAFLRKDRPGQADVNCRYIGFECPDEFVVGYGLDYAQRYRNLPYVGVMNPEACSGHAVSPE